MTSMPNWVWLPTSRNRPSREKYTETWEQHDTQYAQMLQALIAELKKT